MCVCDVTVGLSVSREDVSPRLGVCTVCPTFVRAAFASCIATTQLQPAGCWRSPSQVFGDFFGPVQPNLVEGLTGRAPLPGAAATLQARTCAPLDNSHTQVRCAVPSGVGQAFRWSITVGGATSGPSVVTTSFGPPRVSSFALRTTSGVGSGRASVPTMGGVLVTITGTNLGADVGQVCDLDTSTAL